jgi:hypothetical protein
MGTNRPWRHWNWNWRSERARARLAGAIFVVGLLVAGTMVAVFSSNSKSGTSRRSASTGAASVAVGQAGSGPSAAPVSGGAGVSKAVGAQSSGVALGAPSPAAPGLPAAAPSGAPSAGPGLPAAAPLPAGLGDAKVVRTGDISLQALPNTFSSVFSAVTAVAQRTGGFVVSSSRGVNGGSGVAPGSRPATEPTSGTLELRVPGDRFNDAQLGIESLGARVLSEQLTGNDVGGQLVDLDARIANLRTEEEALRVIEGKFTSTSDVLGIQPQLADVRTQIEELTGEHARLDNAVALSSLKVTITEPGAVVGDPTPRPTPVLSRSWSRAVAGVQAVTGGVLVVLGYLLPVLIVGLLGWLPVALYQRRRSRRPLVPDVG